MHPKNYYTSQIMIEENSEYLSLPLENIIQKRLERRRQNTNAMFIMKTWKVKVSYGSWELNHFILGSKMYEILLSIGRHVMQINLIVCSVREITKYNSSAAK